jgi:natural product precursor
MAVPTFKGGGMKKALKLRKLKLNKTTIRRLSEEQLRNAAGRDYVSLQGCTWGCDSVDSELYTSCRHCGEE